MHTVIQVTWECVVTISERTTADWSTWLKTKYPEDVAFAYEMDLTEHHADLEYSYGGCVLDFKNQKIVGAYERTTDEYLFNKLIAMFLCNIIGSDPQINTDNILDIQFLAARDTAIGLTGFLFDIDYK